MSELLGKATIDTNTYGKSSGRNGNYSTNYQITGRELMTPDEVRMLDNRYAILFIRGERPVIDEKHDIFTHPDVGLTIHGGAAPYLHGTVNHAIGDISLTGVRADILSPAVEGESMYELLSNEDIEEEFSI